ncbi:Malonate decarboxylase acyl carrier protein [Fundidesulfovibrio magnetotacticus]|uniref:Malonate decarboxylase acyl carrier protein n=1 Tax=Fundidesulfovibrio magnetotacticus TaxID=2730080 RepID=A0A6V8LJR2_9BACT|nr:malonate decarboxylase acyl carrier protein [Fundidesulfovibrio magnetotacticus]GFK92972.1 Malonate decarboxylase acyl carrier protein [Fundidesulfovibrio magnetotacticus]
MEHLEFTLPGRTGGPRANEWAIAGVVTSGNLEVLAEAMDLGGACRFVIDTSAKGYRDTWRAVVEDFMAKHAPGDVLFSINDSAASPAVVGLRLAQALEALNG